MATQSELSRHSLGAIYRLARVLIFFFGVGAFAWGLFVFPLSMQEAPLNAVASELLLHRTYKTQFLLKELSLAEEAEKFTLCNPTALRSAVVLRLAFFNDALARADHVVIDSGYSQVTETVRMALSCAPTDPYVWLTLFWLDAAKQGLTADNLRYLRMSYRMGPNEGWIALWRNRVAVSLFEQLPDDLADEATNEFIGLVNTGRLYPEAAAIFLSATPGVRGRLAERLKAANPFARQILARVLYEKGIDPHIPDVERPDTRPWQ